MIAVIILLYFRKHSNHFQLKSTSRQVC